MICFRSSVNSNSTPSVHASLSRPRSASAPAPPPPPQCRHSVIARPSSESRRHGGSLDTPRRPHHLLTALLTAVLVWTAAGTQSRTAWGQAASDDAAGPTITNAYCPVMLGEAIDPTKFVEYQGRRVYLCCDLCKRRFERNPQAYVENLPEGFFMTSVTTATPAVTHADDHTHGTGRSQSPRDAESHHGASGTGNSQGGHAHGGAQAGEPAGSAGHAHAEGAAANTHDGDGQETAGHDQPQAIGRAPQPASDKGEPVGGHDHAAHQHTQTQNPVMKFIDWLGNFHPPAVAFPIGLLTAAGVAELLFMVTRRLVFDHASRFCAWFGIIGTVGAGILGWFFAGFRFTDGDWILTTHRWIGTSAALWMLLLAYPTAKAWGGGERPMWRLWYRLALLIAIILVSVNGYFGGAMLYGIDHYAWLSS